MTYQANDVLHVHEWTITHETIAVMDKLDG